MSIFLLENTVNQMLFFLFFYYSETYFCFTCRFTAPSLTCKTSNLLLNGLGSQHSGAQVASKLPRVWHLLSMLGFTSDSSQISASPHQLDLEPYASKPYNAQWNAPEFLHDMHMSRLRNLGLWIPLNYRVDMGASQHRTPKLG